MCSFLFSQFSRLYRSLDDYDVVRGIFGGKVGTKSITCDALQAEANTDYAEAVKLYNEVLFSHHKKVLTIDISMSIPLQMLKN